MLFAGFAVSGGAGEEPPAFTTAGWGPVRAGMTLDEAARALGAKFEELPERERFPELEDCWYAESDGAPGLNFMIWRRELLNDDDPRWRIVRIDTHDPRYATLSGVRVGDSEDVARRVYGGRLSERPHPEVPGGFYLSIYGRTGELLLEVTNGKVHEIRSGFSRAVGAKEGCW
jgi:hypothetical protein